MTKQLTKTELEIKLSAANKAYAAGIPFLTDTEYDLFWQQLYAFDQAHPLLWHTAQDQVIPSDLVAHHHQIFGTNKAFNIADLKPYLTRFGDCELVFEPKYDGCAAVFSKTNQGYKLVLEGDGIKGQDITRHLPYIDYNFIPKHTQTVEIIIPGAHWNAEFGANPRNVIAGWLNRKTFHKANIAQMISHNNGPLYIPYAFHGDLEALSEHLLKAYKAWSDIYPIDGIMIKPRAEKRRVISGHNNVTYAWSIAWKPPIQIKETSVIDIKWNVSRQGRIIPTVVYSPIELCHTINSRATGNNAKWLAERNIQVGSIIIVGKAGEIIPKILEVSNPGTKKEDQKTKSNSDITHHHAPFDAVLEHLNSVVPEPTKPNLKRPLRACPICNSPTKWQGVNLICDSEDCIGQLVKRVSYFYSKVGFDLKSIGENMITQLILEPQTFKILVKNRWALLDPDSFNLTNYLYDIWGTKRTEIYLRQLKKLQGRKNIAHFLTSLGYPGLAYKTVLKIFYYIQENITNTHIPGKVQQAFVEAYIKFQQVKPLLKNFTFAALPKSPKIRYCITGTLTTSRVEIIDYLTKFRWEWSNQISKHVDYLIIGSSRRSRNSDTNRSRVYRKDQTTKSPKGILIMAEDYQNTETKMSAVRIEAELYKRVTKHLHQGQHTALMRNIFASLDVMLAKDQLVDITNYIYKANSLTLKPVKD